MVHPAINPKMADCSIESWVYLNRVVEDQEKAKVEMVRQMYFMRRLIDHIFQKTNFEEILKEQNVPNGDGLVFSIDGIKDDAVRNELAGKVMWDISTQDLMCCVSEFWLLAYHFFLVASDEEEEKYIGRSGEVG